MKYIILTLFIFFAIASHGQTTIVRGTITDEKNQPTPFVSVSFNGTTVGVITDDNGRYVLRTSDQTHTQIKISLVGYKNLVHIITPGKDQTINVKLQIEGKLLNEVTVSSAKRKR